MVSLPRQITAEIENVEVSLQNLTFGTPCTKYPKCLVTIYFRVGKNIGGNVE